MNSKPSPTASSTTLRPSPQQYLSLSSPKRKQKQKPGQSQHSNSNPNPNPNPNQNQDNSSSSTKSIDGCQICGKDDDHAHLLLCEACNDEYHTYCLTPPLTSVPEGDFFCHKCKPLLSIFVNNNDELDRKVSSLGPIYTKRFGEIIWAAGGNGFGWWPACIYDPRLTVGNARKLALKHLGKKHLVYFFGCADAPFTVLPDNKCLAWDAGLMEELDEGRVAKGTGKNRAMMFEWALQAAIAENDKPIECRLDWNHEEDPFVTGTSSSSSNHNNSNGHGHGNMVPNAEGTGGKKRQMNVNAQSDKKRNRNNNINNNNSSSSNETLVPTRRSNRSIKPSPLLASIQQQQQQQQQKEQERQQQKEHEKNIKGSKAMAAAAATGGGGEGGTKAQSTKYKYKATKTNRRSVDDVMENFHSANANQIEETFDDSDNDDYVDIFFCKILRKLPTNAIITAATPSPSITTTDASNSTNFNAVGGDGVKRSGGDHASSLLTAMNDVNIGFITLSKKSTFADARKKIHSDFDDDHALLSFRNNNNNNNKKKNDNWKFYIPHLGPMSKKQETKFGSMYDMLLRNGDGKIGNGTSRHPLKVIIYEC